MEQVEQLSTERIAAAGSEPREQDSVAAGEDPRMPDAGTTTDVEGENGQSHRQAETDEEYESLLDEDELQRLSRRWQDIQSAFVDEPRRSVQDADALVAELMQKLAQMFSAERDKLETQWSRGDEVSTEDLRVGLQRYRSFFQRLLAA